MLDKFFERLQYEGYTYDELCAAAGGGGGGGKSGGGARAPSAPIQSTTVLGDELSVGVEALKGDDIAKTDELDIVKKGTRGLQIPLTKGNTTTATATPAKAGVQI